MKPSYILLVILLVAATTTIFGTYMSVMNNIRLQFADELAVALHNLLNTPPGIEREATIAIPHDIQIEIKQSVITECGAPTCIYITTPQGSRVIPTHANVETKIFDQTGIKNIKLPHGVYKIKAKGLAPDPDKVTACIITYFLVADVENSIKQGVPKGLNCDALPTEEAQKICYDLGGQVSNTPYMLWEYFCAQKKIILEITS
ncbi:MAG: hypothetical protein ACP5IE_03785 [Infirmifilum sp.]